MTKKRSLLKATAWSRKQAKKFWRSNSGDWQWLAEKPMPIAGISRRLWRDSVPSLSFFVMLTLSGVISTLGLLSGSTATVIGAMIIAPLMGPIIGMGFAMAVANRRLLKRASLTLAAGSLATVLSAMLITQFIGLRTLTSEITARTEPTLIDLVVALAAGAAGAFAKSRHSIADAFPGVAIAVALVPPLSVIGIGMALASQSVTSGATLLFITNLAATIFSGSLIFLWQRYGSIERAQSGLLASFLVLSVLGIPLGVSLRTLLVQANVKQQTSRIIRDRLEILDDADIQALRVRQQDEIFAIEMEIIAPSNSVSRIQIESLRDVLTRELERPVALEVKVIPVEELNVPVNPADL